MALLRNVQGQNPPDLLLGVVQCYFCWLDPGHGSAEFSLQNLREHQIKRRHRPRLRRLEQGEEEGKRRVILLSARVAVYSDPGGFESTGRCQRALCFVTGKERYQLPGQSRVRGETVDCQVPAAQGWHAWMGSATGQCRDTDSPAEGRSFRVQQRPGI